MVDQDLGPYERNALGTMRFVAEPPPRRGSNPVRVGFIRVVRPRRTEIFAPPAAPPRHALPTPPKNTRTAFDRAGSVRVYPDSLLAVTFLDGYVVSAILVPDLHQCLAATAFAFGGLDRVAGRLDWLAIDLKNHVVFT